MMILGPVFCLDHKSENKPGREGLLLDYQNLSDHHLITTEANRQLGAQNQYLQQHNTWLTDQSTQLIQTSAGLTIKNKALTSASVQLQVQLTNLTNTYEMLLQDHGHLMYKACLRTKKLRNFSLPLLTQTFGCTKTDLT